MKKIGVIGGMGPMASQLFYKMIIEKTPAETDQEHIEMVILSDTAMPDRTKAILSGDYEKVYKRLLNDAKVLERCGCDAISITCNTAHFFADMIAEEVGIPIIHMIRETVAHLKKEHGSGRIAVLATDGTIKTGTYQKALQEGGFDFYIPSEETQKKIMYEVYDRIKRGEPCDAEKWVAIEREIKDAGCSRAILACTELSIIKIDDNLDDYYLDAMTVLAQKTIEFAKG